MKDTIGDLDSLDQLRDKSCHHYWQCVSVDPKAPKPKDFFDHQLHLFFAYSFQSSEHESDLTESLTDVIERDQGGQKGKTVYSEIEGPSLGLRQLF